MTALAIPVTGAPSTNAQQWKQISWSVIRARVYRLQVRIAKAIREERWGKAKALQYVLSHSFGAKLLAVKWVVSSKGSRTPGIDGVKWKTSAQRWRAAFSLSSRGYRAQPLRRVLIPKRNGKLRPLGMTARDGGNADIAGAIYLYPRYTIEPCKRYTRWD